MIGPIFDLGDEKHFNLAPWVDSVREDGWLDL